MQFLNISIYTLPQNGSGNSKGEGGRKKSMKLNWNHQRGGGGAQLKKNPVGVVWIFSRTRHSSCTWFSYVAARGFVNKERAWYRILNRRPVPLWIALYNTLTAKVGTVFRVYRGQYLGPYL